MALRTSSEDAASLGAFHFLSLELQVGDLTATQGTVARHTHLVIGRYHQHSVETLNPEMTVLEFFKVSVCVSASVCQALSLSVYVGQLHSAPRSVEVTCRSARCAQLQVYSLFLLAAR